MKSFASMMALVALTSFASPFAALADDSSPNASQYSTVKLFFVNQFDPVIMPVPPVEPFRPGGGGGGMAIPPQTLYQTARLFLDDAFIGNAMLRHLDVRPTLNLAPGEHKIRIECDGFQKFEQTLTVLENGSTQWLVVNFKRSTESEQKSASPDQTN